MAGAKHGLVGDSYGTDLPETTVSTENLVKEKNMAKFSKSREFKVLKEHLEQRIGFYQRYLPDGRDVSSMSPVELQASGNMWVAANCVIGEFQAVLKAYEQANEVVNDV